MGDVIAARYRIVSQLGRGGMGAVFLVERIAGGERLAMKTLLPGLIARRELVLRFEREAKAATLLGHPNIIDVLDFGALPDGTLFLVMELVEGRQLGDVIDLGGAMPPERVLAIARRILDALAHAHEQGIIHRDIKADNVMIVGETGVKILDFGIAKLVGDAAASIGGEKLTQAGVVFGSPDYMAPEQALGQEVDARADLYSLGVLLFEMLTGRRPFLHLDPVEVVRMQIARQPPTLAEAARGRWFAPPLEALIARALAKRREDRFASAREMLAAVDGAEAALAPPPPAPPRFTPAAPVAPRPPIPIGVLFGGALFLLMIVILLVIAAQG